MTEDTKTTPVLYALGEFYAGVKDKKWSLLYSTTMSLIQLVLIYLQVHGIIAWSWVWVTAPIWGVWIPLLMSPFIVVVLQWYINRRTIRNQGK